MWVQPKQGLVLWRCPQSCPCPPIITLPTATTKFGGNSYGKVSWAPVRRKERRKEEKKSQPEKRERMIRFFLTWLPWLLALCPHPQQHGPSWTCCHSYPCAAPGLCSHPGASQATGLAACRDPWGPPASAPAPVLSWVRSQLSGEWPLHIMLEPHFASLAALGGSSACRRPPDGLKEGAVLMHHQRRV